MQVQVAVCEHHTLGLGGGPARVEELCDIVLILDRAGKRRGAGVFVLRVPRRLVSYRSTSPHVAKKVWRRTNVVVSLCETIPLAEREDYVAARPR